MSDVGVPVGSGKLGGIITIPASARGIVIFAHGSGSSRLSPRNQYVSQVLNESGIATLLVDLLTVEEAIEDEKTRKLRFDIELLSGRLAAVTEWVRQEQETKNLSIGYFGASTGAAATLIAAVQFPCSIKAIVPKGGRVDLAGSVFKKLNSNLSILFWWEAMTPRPSIGIKKQSSNSSKLRTGD